MSYLDKIHLMHPTFKKTVGVIFIVYGIIALLTPFTPGSWLTLIGLELVGVRIAFVQKVSNWFKQKTQDLNTAK